MNRGIVIIALGYPLYGNCAFNLALSLKNTSDVPICLVYENSAITKLTERELSFFDYFIELPEEYYVLQGTKQYQRAKLCIDLFAKTLQWDEVMYMDADNLWFDKSVDNLFTELKERDFYIGYNGHYDARTNKKTNTNYTYWVPDNSMPNIRKACSYHNITKILPQTVSGFLYFKASEKIDSIFQHAREVYDDPSAPTITWAAGKPDEYCMNISLALHDYTQEYVHIFYFDSVNGNLHINYIKNIYWGMATGGHKVQPRLIHIFNHRVNDLCIKHNVPTRHYHVDKKDVIESREKF